MITRKIKTIAFLIIAALALSSPVIYAYPHDAGSKREKAMAGKAEVRQQQLYSDLKLTDEQKKLLEENKNKQREQTKGLFKQMQDKRALLTKEIQKDALNMERVNQINNELKELHAQMLDNRLNHTLEVRKILTPEQFKKFMAKMEERKENKGRQR